MGPDSCWEQAVVTNQRRGEAEVVSSRERWGRIPAESRLSLLTSGEAKPKPRVAAGVGPRGVDEEREHDKQTSSSGGPCGRTVGGRRRVCEEETAGGTPDPSPAAALRVDDHRSSAGTAGAGSRGADAARTDYVQGHARHDRHRPDQQELAVPAGVLRFRQRRGGSRSAEGPE